MILPSWFSRSSRGSAIGQHGGTRLLDPPAWTHAARCERARVDRNGSVLSVVSLKLPRRIRHGRPLESLGDYLCERLRITDTVGWRHDGRLGLLLPDTPIDGAEQVTAEILEFIGPEGGPHSVQIDQYPDGALGGEQVGHEAGEHVPASVGSGATERLFVSPLPRWKRTLDIAGATVGLALTGPAILVLAGIVRSTSRGGAFFVQEREGLGGRRFKMIKLRTMVLDAEQKKRHLREHSVQDGPAFKMYRDPRVTRIGRLLRATSLDELPQLINVLRGDMSLVGPRPLPVDESLACQPWQRQRLQVPPGITCTWQVSGRNTVSFVDWMRMDLSYARRVSPGRDLRLLLMTLPAALTSRGPR